MSADPVNNAYVLALAGRPLRPSVGDLVECLDDICSEKGPCSGAVMAVAGGDVCVKWSDGLEILRFSWHHCGYSPPNGKRPAYWRVEPDARAVAVALASRKKGETLLVRLF